MIFPIINGINIVTGKESLKSGLTINHGKIKIIKGIKIVKR